MGVSTEEIEAAKDLFADLGEITSRKMMGGACLYAHGTIFAILHSDGGLMLKAKGGFIDRMRDLGQTQWTYSRDGAKETAMPYWTLPEDALDDPARACELAKEALSYLE